MPKPLPKFIAEPDPSIYFSDNYVVLDFEIDTGHGDYGRPIFDDNGMLLGVWKYGPQHAHRDVVCEMGGTLSRYWANEYGSGWRHLIRSIEKADFLVCHNCKYELGWLARLGADLHNILIFDTKLGEYVLLGNLAAGAKELGLAPLETSLDMLCRRRGLPIKDPAVDVLIGHGINPVRIPRSWLQGRCEQDVETTEQVFLSQRRALADRGLLGVLYTRCLLTPVLVDIEREGLKLDADAVRKTHAEYSAKLAELEKRWNVFTGGINFRSAKQKATLIYETLGFDEIRDKRGNPKRNAPNKAFPNGQPKTDAKTLALLKARTAKQREFLELRKEISQVASAISKNLDFFLGVVNEQAGVFHAELQQTTTATHRLSSVGIPTVFTTLAAQPVQRTVQMQNTPRVFKKLFIAKREGYLIGDPDGSQLEFRTAAFLGNDEQAKADIEDVNYDVHRFTASILNDVPYDEVETEGANSQRQLAKPDTFKPLYGGTRGNPAQERYYAAFRKRYPGIARTQEAWVQEALETKKVRTPWGLIYYFPTARRSSSGYVNVTSVVYNYPIQALATAEIIPIAVVYLWHRIHAESLDDKIIIVNLVHDDAPSEVHPAHADDFVRLTKQSFTHDVYRYLKTIYGLDFDVPLGVGIKLGTHWGTGTEQQFNIYADGREVRVK